MLLAFSGFPVFMAVQAVKSIERTAYETWVTAAFKPLDDILVIKVESRELTRARFKLQYYEHNTNSVLAIFYWPS